MLGKLKQKVGTGGAAGGPPEAVRTQSNLGLMHDNNAGFSDVLRDPAVLSECGSDAAMRSPQPNSPLSPALSYGSPPPAAAEPPPAARPAAAPPDCAEPPPAAIDPLPPSGPEQYAVALQHIDRANEIARDIGANASFRPSLKKERRGGADVVHVLAVLPSGVQRTWTWETFALRVPKMELLWREWSRSGAVRGDRSGRRFSIPFAPGTAYADDADELIGEAAMFLMSLGNMMEHEATASVLSSDEVRGTLDCELRPVDAEGGDGPWEGEKEALDPFVDDPSELLGRSVEFTVKVVSYAPDGQPPGARAGRAHMDPLAAPSGAAGRWRHVFVRYKVWSDDQHSWGPDAAGEEWHSTARCVTPPYRWDFQKRHTVGVVDEAWLAHLQRACVLFELWGQPADAPPPSARPPPPLPAAARRGSTLERQGTNPLSPTLSPALEAAERPAPKPEQSHRGHHHKDKRHKQQCVVCGRRDRAGEVRKSGFKCKECVGIPSR